MSDEGVGDSTGDEDWRENRLQGEAGTDVMVLPKLDLSTRKAEGGLVNVWQPRPSAALRLTESLTRAVSAATARPLSDSPFQPTALSFASYIPPTLPFPPTTTLLHLLFTTEHSAHAAARTIVCLLPGFVAIPFPTASGQVACHTPAPHPVSLTPNYASDTSYTTSLDDICCVEGHGAPQWHCRHSRPGPCAAREPEIL